MDCSHGRLATHRALDVQSGWWESWGRSTFERVSPICHRNHPTLLFSCAIPDSGAAHALWLGVWWMRARNTTFHDSWSAGDTHVAGEIRGVEIQSIRNIKPSPMTIPPQSRPRFPGCPASSVRLAGPLGRDGTTVRAATRLFTAIHPQVRFLPLATPGHPWKRTITKLSSFPRFNSSGMTPRSSVSSPLVSSSARLSAPKPLKSSYLGTMKLTS